MSGSCWACGATSFTGTFAEKLTPALVDLNGRAEIRRDGRGGDGRRQESHQGCSEDCGSGRDREHSACGQRGRGMLSSHRGRSFRPPRFSRHYLIRMGRVSKPKPRRINAASRRSDIFIPVRALPTEVQRGEGAGMSEEHGANRVTGAARGPEMPTLAERFVGAFRLPYPIGCLFVGFFLFGIVDVAIGAFVQTSNLSTTVAKTLAPASLLTDLLVAY